MPADVELGIVVTKRGDGADAVARDLRGAARAADDLADQLGQVDRKLIETRLLAAAAGKEFIQTGDASPLRALLRDERQLNNVRRSLSNAKTDLENLAKAGEGVGTSIADSLSNLPGLAGKAFKLIASNPEIAIAGVAAGAILVDGVLSVLGGAILAGTAAGALAAGIAGAAQSAEVHGAWAHVVDVAGMEFKSASSVLVEPLVQAAGTVVQAFSDVMPDLRTDFGILAPVVEQLAQGVAGLVRNIQPGLTSGLEVGAQILGDIAHWLPQLGDDLSFFFDALAAGGPGLREAFSDVLTLIDGMIQSLGIFIGGAGQLYSIIKIIGEVASGQFTKAAADIGMMALAANGAGEPTRRLTTNLHDGAKAAADMAAQVKNADQAINDFIGNSMSATQIQVRLADGWRKVGEEVRQHGKSLDINTEQGNKNAQMLLGQISLLDQDRQNQIKMGVGTDIANNAFQAQVYQLQRHAIAMGFSQEEVKRLTGDLTTLDGTNADPNVLIHGADQAREAARSVGHELLSIPPNQTRYISIYHNEYFNEFHSSFAPSGVHGPPSARGSYVKAASGLVSGILSPRNPGTMVLAGEPETGGEVLAPLKGITRDRAMSLAGVIGGAYGFNVGGPAVVGGGGTVIELRSGGSRLDDLLVEILRNAIRDRGGDVQTVLGK
jgi:hypothetical protein